MGRKRNKVLREKEEELERFMENKHKRRGLPKPVQFHKDKSRYDRKDNVVEEDI